MDGSGHRLPLEWNQGPYDYDPYTNTFLLPLPSYGHGWGVEYRWNPRDQQQGPSRYSRSSVPPLGRRRRPRRAPAQRGRGGGRHAQRGRGGRHRVSSPRQQDGGPGLLGSDPSSQRPPDQLPPPSTTTPDETSSSQPPAQLQPPAPVPLLPVPPDSSSPSSHTMTPPPPVSDPVKDSHVIDLTMTTDAKMDDAQDDVVVVSLGGSSTDATDDKKTLLPLDPPAPPMKNSVVVDASMARRDDDQGDVLGLNFYMARKRLLSTKASSLAVEEADAEEAAKAAARKKTRLGWGQGLAKYENRSNNDDETTHNLDAANGEGASSHGSSPPQGSKGHGDSNSNSNSLDDDMAEMRLSHAAPNAPALFSKGSSHPLTGDLGDPGKNVSISSMTEKAVFPAEMPPRFSRQQSPSPVGDDQDFMEDGGIIHDHRSNVTKVSAVPHKEDKSEISNSSSRMTAIAVSELAASSQGCHEQPADESSMKFKKVEDIPPRQGKVIVTMVQKHRMILDNNVLSDEAEANELQGSELIKEWSQEEKDVFSEKITAFGMNFSKVSSFLMHKTTADCMEYYFEHYTCHNEAQKCLPTAVMQSQENCCNENDEHSTGKVLVGEPIVSPSLIGMTSSQAVCLTIPKTEAPVSENFNEDSCSNESVCITKSCSKVKENVPQSVQIAILGDEGNCVAGGSCGEDTLKIMSLPDESSAKLENGIIKGDQLRSGAKNSELCSSLKECNDGAKHHSWKVTEKKLAKSNIDDGRIMAPSDMENPNSKDSPCITSDPAMLTGPAFVQFMMKIDQEMEKKESEKNDDKVKGKEENNPVLCVASKHCSGIQLSCEVNSHKQMEKVDNIPILEGNDLSSDMENPTNYSSPCVNTNASVRLRASDATYKNTENNDDEVKSKMENPVQSVASKECNGIQCTSYADLKGKSIIPSPEVNDLNVPPMQISNVAPKTYHLPSSSRCAALDIHAKSSYVAMDIDLNIPLDVTSIDLGNSNAEASMARSSEATDSDATLEIISPSTKTTSTVTQTAQKQPANQSGSTMLFGRAIYQGPSSGTTNHTPIQVNQTIVIPSHNVPSNPVVPPVTWRRGGQVYPSVQATTTTTNWRSVGPNNQQSLQALLSNVNRMPAYGGSTSGASASAAWQFQLQPGSSSALVNMINQQQRQQVVANITQRSIMSGGVSLMPSHVIQRSSGGAGFVNLNGFSSTSTQQRWPFPVVDTNTLVVGYPCYYPPGANNANQDPATAATMPSTGTNNGEGASTSNTRAPPGGGRGRDPNNSSWLSLGRN